MDIASFVIIFILTWWMVLFMVLPWGIEMVGANDEGNLPAAPRHHNLKKKLLITSVIAIIVSMIIFMIVQSGIVDFRSIANDMFYQDFSE
jgi:predicted secreted protein